MPITLEIKAKHFEDASFLSKYDCPVARAYKELTGNRCSEEMIDIHDFKTGAVYKHEEYGISKYLEDLEKTKGLFNNKSVIRTIELIEEEPYASIS